MFATSSVWQLGQTKDERRKRKNQQIGTEMPRMYNVKQIQHEREKYKIFWYFLQVNEMKKTIERKSAES